MNNINLPDLITSDIFSVNNFDVKVYSDTWGDYLVIDDFWTYPDKIHELALKIPTVKLAGAYDVPANGTEYYDGRSQFVFYKKELFISVLEDIVNKCFNLIPVDISTEKTFLLSNNLFNITPEAYLKYKNCYYGPHQDGPNTIASITYFNKEYDDTDGTAIFNKHGLHKTSQSWVEHSDVNKIGFLPAKYNRLIIYDGNVHHASTIGPRWATDVRHTMVYFMEVYK
jgi:hypothetical protein